MSVTISLTDAGILTALRSVLMGILPGIEIIRGQNNRVSEPPGTDFVVMTVNLRARLSTNADTYSDPISLGLTGPEVKNSLQPTQVTVQLDVHGPASGDNAQIVTTLLRDDYACEAFAASGYDVQPLWVEDPRQVPFINAEAQFEFRWVVDAVLQANPVIGTPQDFTQTLTAGLIEVDAVYPPGGGVAPIAGGASAMVRSITVPTLQTGAASVVFYPADEPGIIIPAAPYPLAPTLIYFEITQGVGPVTLIAEWQPGADAAAGVPLPGLPSIVVSGASRQFLRIGLADQVRVAAGDRIALVPQGTPDASIELLVTLEFTH